MPRTMAVTSVLAALYGVTASAQPTVSIGRIDTVGGTTYDWQMGGPALRFIANSPGHGIPVVWMRSQSMQTTFPDRNMGMNYYDYATRTWLANDTDFMRSGMDVFTERSGYGTVDVNPQTGLAYVSAHHGSPIAPGVARELSHGTFLFEHAEGPDSYLWPVTVNDSAGWVHAALIDDASRDNIYHARMRTWGLWDPPMGIAPPQPDPGFPCHNIAASRVSHKVALTWTYSEGAPDPGFYRETTDGGTTWGDPTELPWPPAFGGDTNPSYHISGLFPYFDRQDDFHIVTVVMPYIGGRGYINPVELWHWCRENTPEWSRIRRIECHPANIRASVGYNALLACRPSIGEDRYGGLHVCWEQFDTLNFEPGPPAYLRADIWLCDDNADNGASWQEPVRITDPDSSSKRFPCVYDYAHEDTLRITYMVDVVAGFFVQGEGPATRNPVIVQHVPIYPTGVEEKAEGGRMKAEQAFPSLMRAADLALLDCRVFDMTGRDVTKRKARLAPGVYFLRDEGGGPRDEQERTAVRKVVVQ